ncbi:MAG: sigma-70 family RNA polymerase sigma factor [Hyphomicrobiales bacterium]
MARTARRVAGTASARPEEDRLAALLGATGSGDRAAFSELYRLTSGRLMGIALGMLGERGVAEDVLQETFLAIWQRAHRYQPDLGSAHGWLTTVARHCTIDRLRRLRASRETAIGGDVELDAALTEPGAPPVPEMVCGRAIRRCLEQLKATRRRLILLAFCHGFTHQELSARTAAPLGTVKSDIRRGLKDLRTCLEA